MVEWPDISLLVGSNFGRGMLVVEGLFSNGTAGLLGVAPLKVPCMFDMSLCVCRCSCSDINEESQ